MEVSKNIMIKSLFGEDLKRIVTKIVHPFRNCFILFNFSNKAQNNKVNLNYWSEAPNLGDSISPLIVKYMLSQKNISLDSKINGKRHLYAVGSILTAGVQDCTVWGSGVLNSKITYRLENRMLDIRSVRGPLTRIVLADYGYVCPEIYGDPAIFMPDIYTPTNINKESKIGLIAHKDYKMSEDFNTNYFKVIDIKTDDYEMFIDELVNVDKIISSSLHGIILAEAYGIPAILLRPQVDLFKYYDYYYSTGRFDFPIADSISEAMNMECCVLPDFTEMKKNIKNAFPYDIFTN